ncbi:sigma-54-dependent Fis family transcriptional regulator [Xanthobacter autotrophicus DSM 431]|uniref:sigma-54-dependent Fis family transcriptional regulator n=1 Tax=Xanthobacter nonsaccharivorans TaxID=3119912 RepID=UPI0037284394
MKTTSAAPEIAATSELDIRSTTRAWEDFLSGKEEELLKVRRVVSRSWRRSLAAGVDPSMTRAPRVMENDELERLRQNARLLLDSSRSILDRLDPHLRSTQSIVLLTDARGLVLDAIGDPRIRELGREAHIDAGATWNEARSGTNAIGTALVDNVPVQIHASEHFCAAVKRWTCAAAPIHDPVDGEMIGVFDISGPEDTVHPLCLALAMSAAAETKADLSQKYIREELRLRAWFEDIIRPSTADAVILLDRKGRPVRASGPPALVRELMRRIGQSNPPNRGTRLLRLDTGSFEMTVFDAGMRMETLTDGADSLGVMLILPAAGISGMPRRPLGAAPDSSDPFWQVGGQSEVMRPIVARARQIARTAAPVLILGETGTGKEVMARAIHAASPRASGPFVAVNCATLNRELAASELFGYTAGAFTGARREGRTGYFELADGGTLFLDELGDMPLDVQGHFLRVLESGTFQRVGSGDERSISVRVIGATNVPLKDAVGAGRFRADLFFRLNVGQISLPPLRQRHADISDLTETLLERIRQRYEMPGLVLDPAVLAVFRAYDWPGNIRELANALEGMAAVSQDGMLAPDLLPATLAEATGIGAEELGTLRLSEREVIVRCLRENGGNRAQAARQLGVAKSTLYAKLKLYRIN